MLYLIGKIMFCIGILVVILIQLFSIGSFVYDAIKEKDSVMLAMVIVLIIFILIFVGQWLMKIGIG